MYNHPQTPVGVPDVTIGWSQFRSLLGRVLWAFLAAVLVTLGLGGRASAQEGNGGQYLSADAVVSGKEMHSFSADGETVDVIRGDFSLTLGKLTLSGDSAVLWIKERRVGQQTFRDIEAYVESGGGEQVKHVTLRHRGEFRARVGRHGRRDARSLPVFKRAQKMRLGRAGGDEPKPAEGPARPGRPPRTTRPATPATRPKTPDEPTTYKPLTFRADEPLKAEDILDPRDPKKKIGIVILKGNVYMSQGNPDSDLFLEMRADSAVIYKGPGLGGADIEKEISGVYLEGDVVMRRGEQSVRGRRLFYDLRSGRAIVLQPVFRIVQAQRNIPVYIRAEEARQTAAREDPKNKDVRLQGYKWEFRKALVTTSDFATPEYHIAARRVYMEDAALYDETGKRISPLRWRSKLVNTTLNVRSIPLLWTPYVVGDAEEGHTALRNLEVGQHGRYGWGGESKWYLFRLLGVPRPDGFKGRLQADWYERGFILGTTVRYDRPNYGGIALAYGMSDQEGKDDFGTRRKDIAADRQRGRLLWRHKQFLPRDWQFQLEASYLSDRNFLEQFFSQEYWTGKEQETLLYAKKQRDNWALTVLGQWRINSFLTQTESYPDVAGHLIGESLWNDRLTLYSEGRLGAVRYRPDDSLPVTGSGTVARADTRQEVNAPFMIGPVKVLPFTAGRASYWSDSTDGSGLVRSWGQLGATATTHIWRLLNNVENQFWDLHRIKHVITPYGNVFFSATNVDPVDVYPFSPDVERYVRQLGGGRVGVRQLWQTKRGPEGERHTVDWLRLDMAASFYSDDDTHMPADGRYFFYRPEYSLPRNSFNTNLTWHASDTTTFLADANYDIDSGKVGRVNAGVAVSRDPRVRYYLGIRSIEALDSTMGTLGVNYVISRKYTLSFFEQYDFDFDGGQNQATSLTLTRKFPRIYTAFTFAYDRMQDDVTMMVSLWPEGIPEVSVAGSRMSLLRGAEDDDD